MPRGKDFTTTELAEIKGYLKDGCTYAEVAELMGRNKKSIENVVLRQGWTRGRFNDEPEAVKEPAWNDILKEQPQKQDTLFNEGQEEQATEKVAESIANPVSSIPPVIVNPVKEKTLFDFTPRQILHHVFGVLGYYIKGPGQLACKVEQIVNLDDIIKNG